ncbi:MAG: protoporphyrinogen oxidase [Planctomycetaceae bacterium]|nr:protoporphyrinogen oxidase [Planctomycetaceae bacterium]
MADHSSQSERRRIVVVGGGITGLSAAHRLIELSQQQGASVEVILLEASSRCGGVFGSERIGDYLIERGADSFITNKPWGVNLCRRLGLEGELISTDDRYRRSLILHRGKPVQTPDGFNLLAPGQWWPLFRSPLLSWAGKLRVAAELFVPKLKVPQDESLAEFVRRRFGNEVLENVVQPLVGGIYTSDPEQLSLRATLPRFPEMEQQFGSVIRGLRRQAASSRQQEGASGARYGLFATLAGGMQQLLDRLEERVGDQAIVRKSTSVQSIRRLGSGYEIVTESDVIAADGVVVTLPTYRSATLVQSWAPELARRLDEIKYASSAIVVSGHQLADIDHPVDAFGLVIPQREQRRILAVSFLSRKFPSRAPEGRIILRTFVGGAMQPEEMERSDAELEQLVLEELQSVLGVRGRPDFVRVARYNRAMPQYHVGHLERVGEIERLAGELPGFELAGNAYRGVGVPDAVHSGEQAARRLWESIFPAPVKGEGVA